MRRAIRPGPRLLSGFVATLTALALISGCSGGSSTSQSDASGVTVGTTPTSEPDAGQPVPGGSLTYGISAETNSLNPYFGQWAASAYIVGNAIYEPLAALTTDGTAKPYLAESITSNADFTEWTIGLRPGVTFHDGEKLDAAAVVGNLEYVRKSALTGAILQPITSVTAVDDDTVAVAMKTPWSTFPQVLTAQVGYMAAPAMLKAPDPATADPIGTGPFVFKSREIDHQVVVTRNPNYWQPDEPLLDQITFKVLPDSLARAQALEAGDIDAMDVTSPDELATYLTKSEAGQAQLLTNAGQETDEFVIALNTATAPFDDLLARQVLAAAIDQEDLAKIAFQGAYPPAWGNFEPGSPFYISPEDAGYPAPDPVKAKELADEYRQKHGQPLTFSFKVNTDSLGGNLSQVVQQELQAIGVTVTIQQVAQAASISAILTGDYQAGFFAMTSAPTLDKGYLFIATQPSATGISLNYTHLDDPEITAAMDAARATSDPSSIIDDYAIVQREMAKNLDRIFLYHSRLAAAFVNRVHGFTTGSFPASDERAFAPSITAPFYTSMWVEH